MALFVFAILLLIAAVVLWFVHKVDDFSLRLIAAGVALAGMAMLIGSMFNSVPPRNEGVPITFGKVGSPVQAGIHWAAPWTSYTDCPLTQETDIQNGDKNTGTAAFNQAVNISGSDQGGATADVTVQYQIDSKDAQIVYNKFKCNLTSVRDNLIVQRVRSDIAASAVNYASVDLRANRAAMEKTARTLLQDDLQPFGITINDVIIADVNLDAIPQQAANQKVAAYNQIGTNQYLLQAAAIAKQTALVNADAEKAANAAKQTTLSQQILCEQFIQAIAGSQNNPNHISVLNTAGPCSTGTTNSAATSVILPVPGQ